MAEYVRLRQPHRIFYDNLLAFHVRLRPVRELSVAAPESIQDIRFIKFFSMLVDHDLPGPACVVEQAQTSRVVVGILVSVRVLREGCDREGAHEDR